MHVHGFLTVNGEKMSKRKGTFVLARTYLDAGLDPEALRYYFACKTSGGVDDLDLNLSDFVARVNSDVVGKFVNLATVHPHRPQAHPSHDRRQQGHPRRSRPDHAPGRRRPRRPQRTRRPRRRPRRA